MDAGLAIPLCIRFARFFFKNGKNIVFIAIFSIIVKIGDFSMPDVYLQNGCSRERNQDLIMLFVSRP